MFTAEKERARVDGNLRELSRSTAWPDVRTSLDGAHDDCSLAVLIARPYRSRRQRPLVPECEAFFQQDHVAAAIANAACCVRVRKANDRGRDYWALQRIGAIYAPDSKTEAAHRGAGGEHIASFIKATTWKKAASGRRRHRQTRSASSRIVLLEFPRERSYWGGRLATGGGSVEGGMT